jgi:hypothetical protein
VETNSWRVDSGGDDNDGRLWIGVPGRRRRKQQQHDCVTTRCDYVTTVDRRKKARGHDSRRSNRKFPRRTDPVWSTVLIPQCKKRHGATGDEGTTSESATSMARVQARRAKLYAADMNKKKPVRWAHTHTRRLNTRSGRTQYTGHEREFGEKARPACTQKVGTHNTNDNTHGVRPLVQVYKPMARERNRHDRTHAKVRGELVYRRRRGDDRRLSAINNNR